MLSSLSGNNEDIDRHLAAAATLTLGQHVWPSISGRSATIWYLAGLEWNFLKEEGIGTLANWYWHFGCQFQAIGTLARTC